MTLTKSVKLSKKGQLVIPKAMREVLGIQAGDELRITLEGERMVLTCPRHYARATRGMLKGTWGQTHEVVDQYLDRERQSWP